jgi:predicted DNA-binding transcriptional regulator AlpA
VAKVVVTEQTLRKPQAAELLGVSVRTLERWARAGIGPRPRKLGPRLVRYDSGEVLTYRSRGEQQRRVG